MRLPSWSTIEAHKGSRSYHGNSSNRRIIAIEVIEFLEASKEFDYSIVRLSAPTSISLHNSSLLLQLQVLEKELLDKVHIVVSVKVDNKLNKSFSSYILVDCGATDYDFILVDKEFIYDPNLLLYKLKTLHSLEVINSRPITLGLITYPTRLQISIDSH